MLKMLAYLWIIQNIFMIFSAAFRNNMYIGECGLSYKRIGVYIYLLLSLTGLVTTFFKIFKIKSNWYLFRINTAIIFLFLIVGCTINWDVVIVEFNIQKAKYSRKKLDKIYLVDLSFKSLPYLISLKDSDFKPGEVEESSDLFSRNRTYKDPIFIIHNKLFSFFLSMQDISWKSYCLEKDRAYKEIIQLNQTGKMDSLDLRSYTGSLASLKAIAPFTGLKALYIKNNFIDLTEFSRFPHLRQLDLEEVTVTTPEQFPPSNELKSITYSVFNSSAIPFLGNCPQLESISLPNTELNNISGFLELKHLKYLKVQRIYAEQELELKEHFPGIVIISEGYNP